MLCVNREMSENVRCERRARRYHCLNQTNRLLSTGRRRRRPVPSGRATRQTSTGPSGAAWQAATWVCCDLNVAITLASSLAQLCRGQTFRQMWIKFVNFSEENKKWRRRHVPVEARGRREPLVRFLRPFDDSRRKSEGGVGAGESGASPADCVRCECDADSDERRSSVVLGWERGEDESEAMGRSNTCGGGDALCECRAGDMARSIERSIERRNVLRRIGVSRDVVRGCNYETKMRCIMVWVRGQKNNNIFFFFTASRTGCIESGFRNETIWSDWRSAIVSPLVECDGRAEPGGDEDSVNALWVVVDLLPRRYTRSNTHNVYISEHDWLKTTIYNSLTLKKINFNNQFNVKLTDCEQKKTKFQYFRQEKKNESKAENNSIQTNQCV